MFENEANISRKRVIRCLCRIVVFDFRSHTQFCTDASSNSLSCPGSSWQPLGKLKIYIPICRFEHGEIEGLIEKDWLVMVESNVTQRDVLRNRQSVYRSSIREMRPYTMGDSLLVHKPQALGA